MENSTPYHQNNLFQQQGKCLGRILVVDDDSVVRMIVSAILCELGYETMTASDGLGALEVLRNHKNEIDLVLLDMRMPGMTGAECFYQLRTITPDIKVVMGSAYSEGADVDQLEHDGMVDYLSKPYTLDMLDDLLRRVIPR